VGSVLISEDSTVPKLLAAATTTFVTPRVPLTSVASSGAAAKALSLLAVLIGEQRALLDGKFVCKMRESVSKPAADLKSYFKNVVGQVFHEVDGASLFGKDDVERLSDTIKKTVSRIASSNGAGRSNSEYVASTAYERYACVPCCAYHMTMLTMLLEYGLVASVVRGCNTCARACMSFCVLLCAGF
jgi:hypothetical protein